MIGISPAVTLSPRDYDAVLFDLEVELTKRRVCMRRLGKGCSMGFLSSGPQTQTSSSRSPSE
jgi:hypothetical protein